MSDRTPGSFTISSVLSDRTARLELHGELDLASAPQLEESLRAADEQEVEQVWIDLDDLLFMDSTGLRVLLQAHSRCAARGCELLLKGGGPSVRRVLEVSGAIDVLHVDDANAS